MTVGFEVRNLSGNLVAASYLTNYRYRGKVSTSVQDESGDTGSERMSLGIVNSVAPLIFIGGNTVPVQITQQSASGVYIECAEDAGPATFDAYIFDVTTNDEDLSAYTVNSHGGTISHTESWITGIDDAHAGIQVFDDSTGLKVFDAINWQCPIEDAFALTSTLVSSHTYSFNGAALDMNFGHQLVDTGFSLYTINRPSIKWTSGKTLVTAKSNPGWATPLTSPPMFKAPLMMVISVDDLPS